MRLVHLSDLHLGFRQFQRQTPAGINQREADIATVFRGVVDRVIELRPDVVLLAGDIFHNVRPPNPAILHAFGQFSRLTQALPDAIVVMIAGNHDSPRAAETGCILQLFSPLGIHVVDGAAQRLAFPDRELSILAVPDTGVPQQVALDPDPSAQYNILLLHREVEGIIPATAANAERVAVTITPDELGAARWNYVALGHYHVYRQVAPNAYYCGSLDYTSANPWGELDEEKKARLGGKGFLEFDLTTRKSTFHPIKRARDLVDLPRIDGRGLAAADIDAALRANIARVPGGVDDKIVRQVVRDVLRHIAREIDHKLLRELKKRTLHFHLDTRRPELMRSGVGQGAAGRRPSLMDMVRDKLRGRPLTNDIDRERLVERGLAYLAEAEQREGTLAIGIAAAQASEGDA